MRRARVSLGRPSRGDRVSVPLTAERAHTLLDGALDALAKGRTSSSDEAVALAALRRALLDRAALPAAKPQPLPPDAAPLAKPLR